LGTLISHGIFIVPRENKLMALGKMKIPWEISVPKLALILYILPPFMPAPSLDPPLISIHHNNLMHNLNCTNLSVINRP
jgi:hypothetical protein